MADDGLIISILNRIEDKVDEAKVAAMLAAQRAETLEKKVDDHVVTDREIHQRLEQRLEQRIAPLEGWRIKIMAKVGTYAAAAAFVWGVLFAIGKEALASIFSGGSH